MPRTYNKKSDYWSSPRKPVIITQPEVKSTGASIIQAAAPDVIPAFDSAPHYSAIAACGGGSVPTTSYMTGPSLNFMETDMYKNIRSIPVPLETVEGNYSTSQAIALVYQAYFGFAVLRNAINLLVDFSISRIHVKTKNKKAKSFIETWFDSISLNQFMTQFFLEYYRSGNVFIYKFSGRISSDGFNMLKESYSSIRESRSQISPIVPIRYIVLNPMQVYLQRGASYTYGYVRMLSTYEIERLKNPQTDEDKQMFRSFPLDIQRQIKQGGAWRWLFVPLDQNRLYYVFYRKQDYEPLAVPMAYAVLPDIEFKLGLRRVDMAISQTIEQVFVLVTTGRPADQYNQVVGAKNLSALQAMFQNKAIGRVLVADYTTKAEWIIPDLSKIIGPDKYARVDQDIKEGLQYMFFGEDKFANAAVKIRIFIESLKEGRRAFIENFLLPEVKKICEIMNFQSIPELEFEEVKIQDEAIMNRLYVQLAQLGLLSPSETMDALKTGMLPNKDESIQSQKDYQVQRNDGLYQPLIGGGLSGNMNGRPPGNTGTPAPREVSTPIGQSKTKQGIGRAKYHFSMMKIAENLPKMNEVKAAVEDKLVKKWKVKALNAVQLTVASNIAQSIIFNEEEKDWSKSIASYLKEPKDIDPMINQELNEIASEFQVDYWIASILSRSKTNILPDSE